MCNGAISVVKISVVVEINGAIKDGAAATFAFGEMNTTDAWTQMAPEPTSGLLLLLGVAGLALRRKKA